MIFYAAICAVRRLGAAMLLTLGMAAAAQEQTIHFTRPAKADPAKKANAFMPLGGPGDSSPSLFNPDTTGGYEVLPGSPVPLVSGENAAQWQRMLDEKKNWTLMTPEEILDVPTPEKIMGIPDPEDAFQLSVEDRFLRRQEQQMKSAATNNWNQPGIWHNGDSTEAGAGFDGRPAGSVPGDILGSALKNQMFGPNSGMAGEANQKPGSIWASPFAPVGPVYQQTPEQLAGMERFRDEFLEPAATETKPAAANFSLSPAVAAGPYQQLTPANNAAQSPFTVLDNLGKPAGVEPLPGYFTPAPPKKPVSWVQPPPWMQSPLQNSTMPQRQF